MQSLKTILQLQPGIFVPIRTITTTGRLDLIQKWRQERGLPLNPNKMRVLSETPDYTFLDGRLTPFGSRQRQRISKERSVRDDIVKLTGEIDFAVNRHKKLLEDEENRKKGIIGRKLKPKGTALLNSKT
ncbi:unnamed protein product [Phyllotreta striolata]|uniref:Large ribosomal subunit protein mL52 n=1 Tax=Phyllotreta striolata TaxID=444603 RepID=A0A9N9TLZ3_PHYSR|nr:unnamed protein product [Phyllotreta striolata]